MGLVINIVLLLFSVVLLAVAGGFATSAANKIKKIPKYEGNPELKSARKWLVWAAVITWITLPVLLIITIISGFSLAFGEVGRIIFYIFISLILLVILIIGILSAGAANKIKNSKVTDNNKSRGKAITAAILAFVGFGLVLFAVIAEIILRKKKKEGKNGKENKKDKKGSGVGDAIGLGVAGYTGYKFLKGKGEKEGEAEAEEAEAGAAEEEGLLGKIEGGAKELGGEAEGLGGDAVSAVETDPELLLL